MSLHVDDHAYTGEGDGGSSLLLIHGWGMHGGMWRDMAEKLASHFHVYAVDLPGHGHSSGMEESKASFTLDSVVDELSVQFTGPLAVCGWSLGGQIALRWAMRHPHQVSQLVLVASTPCFVRLADWKFALSVELLEEFAANLRQNYALTLKRFLSLQMRGSEQEREILAVMRDGLFSRGEPKLYALQSGLEILRSSDLRGELPELKQATLVLAGERDTLIPWQATKYLATRINRGRLAMIKGAAHAPFLSHPAEFQEQVVNFLGEDEHG